ncbi:formate dehydrogenase accessory sulfurtransferase FdhD [Marinomonas algarum]|uniref:Sulfur carrier protein FdhD n=1 Tax=Marinomonas algarum TaxID=2883105 RepID=A0A9X1LF64_9GAMM|nr:formate dehydrogenase accessory sulfurtransferase FdhD [Marinomonas algarum]MCB5162430.1 formate dehydrogenase accessory sulfurtransferase FdhD [Marinomonas algarum]
MLFSPLSLKSHQRNAFYRCESYPSQGTFLKEGKVTEEYAELVEEVPLAISINGLAHAVMMVTPIDLDAFTLGLARSEGIIEHLDDVRDMTMQTVVSTADIHSLAIDLIISPRRFAQYKQKKTIHLGATGCGLCGMDSLSQAIPSLSTLPDSAPLTEASLSTLRHDLFKYQTLGNKTGAVHAALLLSPTHTPIICMEDIGRHNALDKVLGYALQQGINLHNHSVLMSSRCSTELVQKAVRVGLSRLIHLASPSTLAVTLALHYGLTLIHLPKRDAPRIFASSLQSKGTENE